MHSARQAAHNSGRPDAAELVMQPKAVLTPQSPSLKHSTVHMHVGTVATITLPAHHLKSKPKDADHASVASTRLPFAHMHEESRGCSSHLLLSGWA
jgi:hypothetical protein